MQAVSGHSQTASLISLSSRRTVLPWQAGRHSKAEKGQSASATRSQGLMQEESAASCRQRWAPVNDIQKHGSRESACLCDLGYNWPAETGSDYDYTPTPMRRTLEYLLIALCLNLWLTQVAAAESNRERARQHVIDGDALKVDAEKAKAQGDAKGAIVLFHESADQYQAAYDLLPHPLMLYNLAQVYRLAGDTERSLALYQEFLDSNPSGEAAKFAHKYVKILKRAVTRVKEREATGEQNEPLGDDNDTADEDTADEDTADEDTADDSSDDDEHSEPVGGANDAMRYGGLGLTAAGVISVAVGIKFGLDARNISTCLTNYPLSCDKQYPSSEWTDESLALQDEGKAAEQRMFVLTFVGAAFIVGGGLLYYLGGRQSTDTDGSTAFHVMPSVDASSAGFALSGRF